MVGRSVQFVWWGWRSWSCGRGAWPAHWDDPMFRWFKAGPIEVRYWVAHLKEGPV